MRAVSWTRALPVAVAVTVGGVEAQEVVNAPTFQQVIDLNQVGGVAVAPDGMAVAYTVRSTDWDENRYDTEIWLARAGQRPLPADPDGGW